MSVHEAPARHATATPIQHRILAVVVAAQAGWIAYLCTRGWFYQDDFTLLSQAVHRGLSLGYLKQPFNGHLAPGVRLTFWILAHTSRLHYGPTIALRVVLQAIATILLFWLLTTVSRSRTVALVITTVYSVSPLLVPGTLWLASSTNLLPAQICVLIVYLAHLRHVESGELRWSLVAGVALLVGVCFWEKTAVTALLLVILSLGWLLSGSLRRRLMGLLRDWRGWILTLAPLGAFTAYFFSHNYGSSTYDLPPRAGLHLIWLQWGHSLWPAVIGAPWRWLSGGETFTGVADPRLATVILGQCAFAALVVAGWWRNRWRGLLAWSLPLVAVAVGEVLIGLSRYTAFGDLPGLQFSYAFDLAVPVALAVGLALRARTPIDTVPAEPVPAERLPPEATRWPRLRLVAGVACVALAASSAVVSALAWTSRWHDSPAKTYVGSILTGLRGTGSSANLFDTGVSPRVLPSVSPNRNLSDLLSVTNVHVVFDRGLPQPQLVTDSGQIVPATFTSVAEQVGGPNAFCPTLVHGTTSISVALEPTVAPGAYFLRIEYFEQRPALVTVTVRNATGQSVGLRGDPTVDFDQQLGVVLLPLRPGSPQRVNFASRSEATNVCMSKVTIGSPVAAKQ